MCPVVFSASHAFSIFFFPPFSLPPDLFHSVDKRPLFIFFSVLICFDIKDDFSWYIWFVYSLLYKMYSLLKGNEPAPQRSDHVMFIRCLHVFFYTDILRPGASVIKRLPPLPLPHLPVSVAIYYSMFRINVGLHMKHLYVPTAHPAFALLLLDAFSGVNVAFELWN